MAEARTDGAARAEPNLFELCRVVTEEGKSKEEGEANHPSRLYKEVWIGLGGTQSAVYATEVSAEEYLAYTTEETEKVEVYRLTEQLAGDIEAAIRQLAEKRRTSKT